MVDVFREYVVEMQKLLFEDWKGSGVENWEKIRAELTILDKFLQKLENDAKNSYIYREDMQNLDNLNEED